MGHRNRRMKYRPNQDDCATPAPIADYGPRPRHEKEAVLEYLKKEHDAKSAFEIAGRVGILEQQVSPILQTLLSEGSCVRDGEVVYAL